ncbi:hypothetical protein EJ04DRAFT_523757 [Polyplosphaeria fusca]|uniref:Uncharacterized protein n=1 Tax=Polyplosphaeria fusca TaxID=682080 RepID=A0A9P4R0P8_9PLEO|nr:hypothetical protein EJ04DRAFT_523757 [Polyplosphaeria fusca]
MDSETPPRSRPSSFNLGDQLQTRKADRAQQHFAYEEYPDPDTPSGINYVVHPLSPKHTAKLSQASLEALRAHLRASLDRYGIMGGSNQKSTREHLARLRLRSLVAVAWTLHGLSREDTGGKQDEIEGVKLEAWWVDDEKGYVVDSRGIPRLTYQGEPVPPDRVDAFMNRRNQGNL